MSVGQMLVIKVSVGQMSVSQMSVIKVSVGQMFFGQKVFDQKAYNHIDVKPPKSIGSERSQHAQTSTCRKKTVFNSRSGCLIALQLHFFKTKLPNLKLKTQHKNIWYISRYISRSP